MSDADDPGSEPTPPERPARLDPDRAIEAARGESQPAQSAQSPASPPGLGPSWPSPPTPVIDVRRYQWMIGGFGVLLLIIFSVYLYAHNGSTTPGVAKGKPLHFFVAPLATSNLDVAANAHPRCNPARPARRGLNVCGRTPIVLAFFALGAHPCEDEVDTLQTVSRQFPSVQFAAVAVNAGRAATDKLVRRRHWTIPVAYDLTGIIGQLYGVTVCPMIEIAGPGGIVAQRLIGEGWERPAALAASVRQFVAGQPAQ